MLDVIRARVTPSGAVIGAPLNRLATLLALASLAGAATAGAQQRPDFAGEWTRAAEGSSSVESRGDASFRVGDMGSGWGSPIRIAQQPNQLILDVTFFSAYDLQPPLRFVYALDGTESTNTVMIGHASSHQRSRVAWQGSTLVITTLLPAVDPGDGRTVTAEIRQVLSLESPATLVVETTRVGILGAKTTVTRSVYTKR